MLTFLSVDMIKEIDRIFHNTITNVTVVSESKRINSELIYLQFLNKDIYFET